MTVLARELDEYQRALDTYARQARGFNNKQKSYQDSVLKDANGNLYLVDAGGIGGGTIYTAPPGGGQLTAASLPGARTAYGTTAIPDEPKYQMVRDPSKDRNAKMQTITGVSYTPGYSDDWGSGTPDRWVAPDGTDVSGGDWTRTKTKDAYYAQTGWGDAESSTYVPAQYTATRWDPNSFTKNPGEWTKTQPNAPEFTRAAAQRMNRPSLAKQEGGLISDVIRTR